MKTNFATCTQRATHLLVFASLSTAAAPADTIRVPGDQPTIQAGIDAAKPGDLVLIADGVYTGPDNKNLDFAGKAITVRSEDGRDKCIIDCEQDGRGFYFHSGEGSDSVVRGLTIRNGFVDENDAISSNGGGILCLDSSPRILDCSIIECIAGYQTEYGEGGGVYCLNSPVAIRGCRFEACDAGFFGGGVALDGSDAIIEDCTFEDCRACRGGGIDIWASVARVRNCEFVGNIAFKGCGSGSAIWFDGGRDPTEISGCHFERNTGGGILRTAGPGLVVRDCTFLLNDTLSGLNPIFDDRGGSRIEACRFIRNNAYSSPLACSSNTVLLNSEFYRNASLKPGGAISIKAGTTVAGCTFALNGSIGGADAVFASSGPANLVNCVLWDNGRNSIGGAPPIVTYSLVEGGWPGEGNIDLDPRFVDLENGDLHLLPDSPAIDAGDPDLIPSPGETDIDRQKRIWNARVDMGADEFGSFAFGDLNCNASFDALDIEPFIVALFEPAAYPGRYPDCDLLLGDINGDQVVDALDIELFIDLLFGT